MKVLVACEFSGTVRDCFIAMGHDAISCDLLPTEARGPHIQGDILDILYDSSWDLIIAHPPCTYLAASGLHWNKKIEGRAEKTEEALDFITAIWEAPVEKLCIENPVGCINTRLDFMPKPQYVQKSCVLKTRWVVSTPASILCQSPNMSSHIITEKMLQKRLVCG